MGSGGVEAADIYYTDLKVSENQVLGEVGKGFEILLYWLAGIKYRLQAGWPGRGQK